MHNYVSKVVMRVIKAERGLKRDKGGLDQFRLWFVPTPSILTIGECNQVNNMKEITLLKYKLSYFNSKLNHDCTTKL